MRLFAIVPFLLAGCVIVEEPQKQAPAARRHHAARLQYDRRDAGAQRGNDPASSQLLTKGEHEGPAFTAAQDSVILQWLEEAQSDGAADLDSPLASIA
jgi:hypothetical protein